MGVNVPIFNFLLKNKKHIKSKALQLGRQGFHIDNHNYVFAKEVFESYEPVVNFDSIFSSDGYTETLFEYFGCSKVDSMDASDYERATIIHDLNEPVPERLYGQYDVIFDGGTIEHIFDVKTVFENVKKMLKVNGVFLSVNGGNNHLGHGFYQFSPDLYRAVFSKEAGFNLIQIEIVDGPFTYLPIDLTWDMNRAIRTNQEETYICAVVEKVKEGLYNKPQETFYKGQWGQ